MHAKAKQVYNPWAGLSGSKEGDQRRRPKKKTKEGETRVDD